MKPTVFGAKCTNCGHITYPNHFLCPKCENTKFEAIDIKGEGTLLTYTKVYSLPLYYETRYIYLGIVQMDMGVRATGQILIENPKIGMKLKSQVGLTRVINGQNKFGLQFVE